MAENNKWNKQGRTNKTIRFPRQIAEEVIQFIEKTGGMFSGFVIDAVGVALEDLQKSGTHSNGYRK